LKIGTNFFLWQFKTEIIYNFVKFGGNIKRFNISFFFTSLFCCCFSGINIPDPQHCSASMKSKIGCSHSSCPWWPSVMTWYWYGSGTGSRCGSGFVINNSWSTKLITSNLPSNTTHIRIRNTLYLPGCGFGSALF
jgi:hypothetical protein